MANYRKTILKQFTENDVTITIRRANGYTTAHVSIDGDISDEIALPGTYGTITALNIRQLAIDGLTQMGYLPV